jgi:hypothetical protein
MKLKGSAKPEHFLPATTPSAVHVDMEHPTKHRTKLRLLAGCLILAGATYAVAQGNTATSEEPAALLATDGSAANDSENSPAAHVHAAPATLVQLVRAATKHFINVNAATAAGYAPFLGCISGSDHGAMGIHYVNGTLLNGEIEVSRPQALIYEPSKGKMQLVGVEFIVDQKTWLANNPSPPVLEGQTFLLVDSPNRYGIPAFFELHVWAWRDNPQGAFVDWNNHVTCEGH